MKDNKVKLEVVHETIPVAAKKKDSLDCLQASNKQSSMELNWHKNLQIYYIINNLSTLCVFILLSKCLYSLYPSIIAIIFFIASYTFATVFAISSIYYSSSSSLSSVRPKSLTTKYQLVEYIKNTPLCYLTFYYFTRLNCLKTTNSFDYNLLLLSTVYFSVQTVVNCILIEIKPSTLLRIRLAQILFLFLFRYFAFLAKLISAVLLYATLTDPSFLAVLRSSADLDSLELVLAKHIYPLATLVLLACFMLFAVWYIFLTHTTTTTTNNNNYQNKSVQHKLQQDQRPHQLSIIGRAAFESYKMIIEYNESLIVGCSMRVSFACVQFFMHMVAAYFWYYRAVIVLAKARAKTTLIGLLTKQNHLRVLMDLYELEEKLKTRQFEVVCVLGAVLISFLSSHIYYTYYHDKIDNDLDEQQKYHSASLGRRRGLGITGSRYVKNRRPSVYQIESSTAGSDKKPYFDATNDSFMTHQSGGESSSRLSGSVSSWIASSVSSSSSSGIFNHHHYNNCYLYNNPQAHHHLHKQMDCSTCCTSIDRYAFDDVFADSMLSLGDVCHVVQHDCGLGKMNNINNNNNNNLRTCLDYDSSSGVASSATSTSISSIYDEFACEWNSSLPHITPPKTTIQRLTINLAGRARTTGAGVLIDPILPPFSTQTVVAASAAAAANPPTSIYEKVMTWIKNTEKCDTIRPAIGFETTIPTMTAIEDTYNTRMIESNNWPPIRFSAAMNSNLHLANSLVNTDSTASKTDQSNFTYFI